MSLFVKICGVTDIPTAEVCVESGADALGLVLASSPRQVDLQDAKTIADAVRGHIMVVTVFRRPGPEEVEQAIAVVDPDLVQADHGFLGQAPLEKRLPVFREGGPLEPIDGRFLYEGRRSGVGQQVNLTEARRVANGGEMILAGGLRPDNVVQALDLVKPAGVDVSSGVEVSQGVKDPKQIAEFIGQVRDTERTFAI